MSCDSFRPDISYSIEEAYYLVNEKLKKKGTVAKPRARNQRLVLSQVLIDGAFGDQGALFESTVPWTPTKAFYSPSGIGGVILQAV